MGSTILVLALCIALVSCEAKRGGGGAPRGPAGLDGEMIFNVMQFGAKLSKKQDSTQAFIQAWNAACNFNGRARVVVPHGDFSVGETQFQGPCKSQVPIIFEVIGTLKAVADDVSEYTGQAWITFSSVDGLILTGGGTFDGQGQAVWHYNDCKSNPSCVHLPDSLHFNGVKNAKIKKINLVNSMGFHMHITNCNLFRVHSLSIISPEHSPNTDGIHISKSQAVKISRSVIRTGDDCISVGQGSTNITINKITCGPGHGISVGSLGKLPNEQDVRGFIAKNCTLVGTMNGVRIKTWPGSDPSTASGFLFDDIVMDNVKNPIIIDQGYGTKSTKPSLVKIRDVIFQNIRGTTASAVAVNLKCSSQVPCQNVRLHNINLRSRLNNANPTATCSNAQVGYTGIQIPPPC